MSDASIRYQDYLEKNLKISYQNIISNYEHFLNDFSLDGKVVLDIGAGQGLFANFLATHKNVKKVVALDEYEGHGSDVNAYQIMRDLSQITKPGIIDIVKTDFKDYQTNEKFNAIFAINVIHHIVNTKENLIKNKEIFDASVKLFSKIRDLLAPEGIFMMQDVCRWNFSFIPYYIRQNRIIDWETKHNPGKWVACLAAAGFKDIKIRYHTPRPFRKVPLHYLLFNHYFVSIFLSSIYSIKANI